MSVFVKLSLLLILTCLGNAYPCAQSSFDVEDKVEIAHKYYQCTSKLTQLLGAIEVGNSEYAFKIGRYSSAVGLSIRTVIYRNGKCYYYEELMGDNRASREMWIIKDVSTEMFKVIPSTLEMHKELKTKPHVSEVLLDDYSVYHQWDKVAKKWTSKRIPSVPMNFGKSHKVLTDFFKKVKKQRGK